MCWRTSFEPFAAQMLSAETPADVTGECLAQLSELAVGIPVDGVQRLANCAGDVVGDLGRDRVRVLVDVQLDRHLHLRSPIRLFAAKVIAHGQVVEAHRSIVGEGYQSFSLSDTESWYNP